MYVSKTDIILFHIFVGAILGLAIHLAFPYMRGIFIPITIKISHLFINFENEISPIYSFLLNLTHAILSSLIPSIIASVLVLKTLKNSNVFIYCLSFSLTTIILNFTHIITIFELHSISDLALYPSQIINPFIIILIFVSVLLFAARLKSPNKAFKPTPESGAV